MVSKTVCSFNHKLESRGTFAAAAPGVGPQPKLLWLTCLISGASRVPWKKVRSVSHENYLAESLAVSELMNARRPRCTVNFDSPLRSQAQASDADGSSD